MTTKLNFAKTLPINVDLIFVDEILKRMKKGKESSSSWMIYENKTEKNWEIDRNNN